MKRYVYSSSKSTLNTVVDIMKGYNIDTTRCRYELQIIDYDTGRVKTLHFNCPGDYLAYFSMAMGKSATIANLADYYYDEEGFIEEFSEIVEENPNLQSLKKYVYKYWLDDTKTFDVKYLKNLSTGNYLYG